MAGPYSSQQGVGADGPPYSDPHPSQPIPAQASYGRYPGPSMGAAAPPTAGYPGQLPPPVPYPKRRRRRLIIGVLVALTLVCALAAVIIYRAHEDRSTADGEFSDMRVKAVIQGYLDALENQNVDVIARNTLCGIYDAVYDLRADRALAKLSSDAFRKQFAKAQVTSIDKIVYWSNYQAQVLFSMRVTPARAGPTREHVQGIAQLLFQQHQILVCSYVLRTAGAY